MQLRQHRETDPIQVGNLAVRDLTPGGFTGATFAEIEVPISGDNPPYASGTNDKIYIGLAGEVEFVVDGDKCRIGSGDVLLIRVGEEFSYHNGGYEDARLMLAQFPAQSSSA